METKNVPEYFRDKLSEAIDWVTQAFFGNMVRIEADHYLTLISKRKIRDAIKYVSLDQDAQEVWDDKSMPQSLKYQNIPQIDISTYDGDYQDTPLIKLLENEDIAIHVVYSASRKTADFLLQRMDPLYLRFLTMSGLDNYLETLSRRDDLTVKITPNIIIVGNHDITDVICNESPKYGITVEELYQIFQKNPDHTYVPYRRGWSRLLNMREVPAKEEKYAIMNNTSEVIANLHPDGSISAWDGASYRTESHGVQAEALLNAPVNILRLPYHGKVRMLNGTHEHMVDIQIFKHQTSPDDKFYAIWSIKGINIHGYEFNMS